MVNSTRGYAALPTRVTRNSREVHHFPRTEREPAVPLAVERTNTQESAVCAENDATPLDVSSAHNQIEGHVVTFVVQESHNPMELIPKGYELVKESHGCIESAPTGLKPLAVAAPTAAQTELPTTENATKGLDPNAAGDKLEGYVPRYFLKEDGKHDDT
jgi:hypothetical protein